MSATEGHFPNNHPLFGIFFSQAFIILIKCSLEVLTALGASPYKFDNPKFSEKGLDDKTYEIKAKKGLKSDVQLKLFAVEGKFKSDTDTEVIAHLIHEHSKTNNFSESIQKAITEIEVFFLLESKCP